MSKPNNWVLYTDRKAEEMDFKTDASLRRYCRRKGARSGWRYVEDCDKYLLIYSSNRNDGGEK